MEDIEQAISDMESGDVSKGLRRLEKAETNADDEERYQIAQLYHQWGHVQRARTMIEELRARYPNEEELAFFLAEILMDLGEGEGEEDEALDILSSINSEGENGPRALLLLADLYGAQGLDEVAEQKLLEAKRTVPDEPVVTLALAEFYFSLADYQKSIPYYENLLQEVNTLGGKNLNIRLGEALSATGYFEESLPYYEKGSSEDPDSEGLFGFGITAYRVGETEKAIQALSNLKKMDPDYAKLYLYLMKSYLAEGATQEALQIADEGLKMDSFNEDLAYEAGTAALQDGKYEDAESYFKKTLMINSLHHEALKSLAALFLQQQRYTDIVELLENIEDSEEQDPLFFWYLATAENQEEAYEQAQAHYKRAYASLLDDPIFLEEYGDFLLEEGQPQEAVSLFEKALSINSSLLHLEEKIAHFKE